MAITFSCACGKKLKVADEMAGKRARCPECQAVLNVPQFEVEGDVLEEVEAPPAAVSARRPAPPPMPPPMSRRDDDSGDEDAEDRPRRRRRRVDPDEEDRAIRRGRGNDDEPMKDEQSSGTGSTAGIVGGILMIVGAAVWFVVGIVWLNRIFFYPPILAIFGIVAIIKGIIDKASKPSE